MANKFPIKYRFEQAAGTIEDGYIVLKITDHEAEITTPDQLKLARRYGGQPVEDKPVVAVVEKSTKKGGEPK